MYKEGPTGRPVKPLVAVADARRLVANARGPSLATDLNGTIVHWNRQATELLGYSASEAVDQRLIDLLKPSDVFGNSYRTTAATLVEQILEGQGVHAFELDLHRRAGRKIRVTLSLVFLLDPEPTRCRAVYLLSPVYRRRRADEALERILDERSVTAERDRRAADGMPPLTTRQREVLRLVVDGLSAPSIAGRLGISVHTVRNHIQLIYKNLGVSNRAEAVSKVLSKHLL